MCLIFTHMQTRLETKSLLPKGRGGGQGGTEKKIIQNILMCNYIFGNGKVDNDNFRRKLSVKVDSWEL